MPAGPSAGYDQPAYAPQPSGYDYGPAAQPTAPAGWGQPQAGADQLATLLQALRDRQIPALPGTAAAPPVAAAAPAPPQADGLALLRMILANPQVLQALQPAAPRAVTLPVPATAPPRRMRSVQIPLGAVINAISALAGQTMTELNASTSEDDPEVPEYLVSEDGEFVVDPTSPEERAALVTHLFLVSEQAQRAGEMWQPEDRMSAFDGELDELDESGQWARDFGFTRRAW